MRKFISFLLYMFLVVMMDTAGEDRNIPANASAELPAQTTSYIALTFDDGPHRGTTDRLLDGLRQRGASATFFLIGEQIRGNEDLVVRMKREGHQVGNHTWGHVKLSGTDTDGLLWEIQETDQLIGEVLGGSGYWVRPPYGLIDPQLQTMVAVPLVKWSVDPRDWENRNREKTVQAVLSAVQPNSIVLLHDIYESSVDAALDIVDKLEEEGYLFVTVEELLRLNGIEPQVGVFYSSGNA